MGKAKSIQQIIKEKVQEEFGYDRLSNLRKGKKLTFRERLRDKLKTEERNLARDEKVKDRSLY